MNDVTTQSQVHPVVRFKRDLANLIEKKELALPSNVTPEAFRNAAIVAVQDNPGIMQCSSETIFRSIRKLAAAGLVPDGREAALVPFKGSCTAMPMVFGLIKMARRSGDVKDIRAHTVYQNEVDSGRFTYIIGDEERLEHDPILFDDKGDAVGYYAIAKLADGTIVRTFMSRDEVEKIRMGAASQGRSQQPKGIWADHYEQMAHKTVIRRLVKRLDLSAEDMRHITMDDDQQPIRDVTPQPDPERRTLAQKISEPEIMDPEPAGHWTDEVPYDGAFPGSDEFTEGVKAAQSGVPVTDCPYENEEARAVDWVGGWHEAQSAKGDDE